MRHVAPPLTLEVQPGPNGDLLPPDVPPDGLPDEAAPMALGIAVSGDRFYELHVRSGGEYFIERGEFGKPTVINAAGGVTFDKRCDVSASGRTMAVGTPGAQVVSIKRLSPTDSDLLVTTSYPELTDAVAS